MKSSGRVLKLFLAVTVLGTGLGFVLKTFGFFHSLKGHLHIAKKEWNERFGEPGQIIFLGDSILDYGNWKLILPDQPIQNLAREGSTSSNLIERMKRVVKLKPKAIVILIGVNDLRFGGNELSVVRNYEEALGLEKTDSTSCPIFVVSVLPVNERLDVNHSIQNQAIQSLNRRLLEMCRQHAWTFVDVYSGMVGPDGQLDPRLTVDGIHLSQQGYLVLGGLIEAGIRKLGVMG